MRTVPSLIAKACLLLIFATASITFAAQPPAAAPVTLTKTATGFTLANGVITVQIDAQSAAILAIQYKGIAMLGAGDRENGYWSLPGTQLHFGAHPTLTVLDSPDANHGDRATISCRFTYDGGPRTVPANVDIHYSLARGASAIYLEAIWDHQPDFPELTFPVGRFAAKLNDDVFDWMTVDSRRNMEMITAYDWNHGKEMNLKEARLMTTGIFTGQVEHKYDYSAIQWETPAYGWSSTKQHVGIWVVTANANYMSGGPTKLELITHRDATFTNSLTAPAPPTLLYVWKGPHYGATDLVIPRGEQWTKTIGPFLLYCNSGDSADGMWHDALNEAARESHQWPYAWAAAPGYPAAADLGSITGRILLHDPQAPREHLSNLRVGLTHADYPLPDGGSGGPAVGGSSGPAVGGSSGPAAGGSSGLQPAVKTAPNQGASAPATPAGRVAGGSSGLQPAVKTAQNQGASAPARMVDWQHDAKFYQYWTRGDAAGNFTIKDVRPGTYTLRAFADGVLGEYARAEVTIAPGKPLRLGSITWTPVRYGRQLWDIGIPDRTSGEFLNGDHYWRWGIYNEYPKQFPNDVHFVIGKSDFHKDWNMMQVPHATQPDPTGRGRGEATTWSVDFALAHAEHGKATLRLALAGTETRSLTVTVNGTQAGVLTNLPNTMVMHRDSDRGFWQEKDIAFDAALLHPGNNTLQLTIPAGSVTNGVQYDYLRLELDPTAIPPK